MLRTLQAQCLGKHRFRYSVYPYHGTWFSAKVHQQAYQHNVPCRAVQHAAKKGWLNPNLSFVSVEPDNLVISAVKKADNENAMVIRLYNLIANETEGKVKLFRPIARAEVTYLSEKTWEANLQDSLKMESEYSILVRLKGFQIMTLKLLFN